ncbi:MAG: hypothetical protein C4562_03620 [Actinobacteria bacterium]|nr:MAG: hypothetical protein C4562_03620 [Actinomycetota bacterium]
MVLLLVGVLAFVTSGVTYASFPPHGEAGDLTGPFFADETENCAGCHRGHTAVGRKLFVITPTAGGMAGVSAANSDSALCLACHGSSNTLADTNVVEGKYIAGRNEKRPIDADHPALGQNNGDLNGGGFSTFKGAAVSSKHDIDGETSTDIVWGGSATSDDSPTGNELRTLTCGDCHDPHGTPNYRLLKTDNDGSGPQIGSREPDYGTDDYLPNYTAPLYGKGKWNGTALEADVEAGISASCWKGASDPSGKRCHVAYKNVTAKTGSVGNYTGGGSISQGNYKSRTGTDKAFEDVARFRHPVNIALSEWKKIFPDKRTGSSTTDDLSVAGKGLPLDKLTDGEAEKDSWMGCLTCHYAHGTSVAAPASDAQYVNTAGANGPTALLRKPNRGVCQGCHNK